MTRIPRAHLVAWGVAGVVLLVVAVRFLDGGAAAHQPPPVRIEGGAETGPVSSSAGGSGSSTVDDSAPGAAADGLYVHVAGAVARPGLYRVPGGSRVAAAVDVAGGPTRRADLAGVNLAAPLQDGQQVVVPARARGGVVPPAPSDSPAAGSTGAGSSSGPGAKLSLSTATAEELDMLDGIGPTLARRIVEYRDAHGGFRSVDELREVEGIGEKRFESLREAVQP